MKFQTVLDNITADEYGIDPVVVKTGTTTIGTYLAENLKIDPITKNTQRTDGKGVVTGEAVTITHLEGSCTLTLGSNAVPEIGSTIVAKFRGEDVTFKLTKVGETRGTAELLKLDVTFSRKIGTIVLVEEAA